ncbi:hypothetical protein NECAME_00790 [Necator americanus]|uniref:Uncharacterized protein n=1 Tax=Necator americanus TaxID=51031 RepID=W2SXT9_NECAM|nr:hypothetical protein NECAME_00790 [Necator americanus]ETN73701.1 hypothetical protein NECAME_00790 [Necator americanus]
MITVDYENSKVVSICEYSVAHLLRDARASTALQSLRNHHQSRRAHHHLKLYDSWDELWSLPAELV